MVKRFLIKNALKNSFFLYNTGFQSYAPVAQLDRALPSGGRGREFKSSRARHFLLFKTIP